MMNTVVSLLYSPSHQRPSLFSGIVKILLNCPHQLSYKAIFFSLQSSGCGVLMPLSATKLFPSRETIFLIMPFFHCRVRVVVFNTTVNKISVILWQSVLLVEETRVHRENHRPVASQLQTLSHNVVSSIPRLSGIGTHNISSDKH